MAAQGRQAAGQCRSVELEARRPGGAQPHGARLRARADQAVGLCAAGPALEQPGGSARAGARKNGRRGAAGCSSCRATRRSATACRSARCPTCRRRSIPTSCRSTPRCRAGRCRRAKNPAEPAPAEAEGADEMARRQVAASFTAATGQQERVEQELGEIGGAVRTALSVEPRDGRLCVFMPPVEALEDYLELIAAAENAAKKTGLPVHIEGYGPPHDPRLNVIRVAPDPGVIEVNIHPASSWQDCVATTTAIYEEARQSRLGADKFMIDGRHTGTGGGNHVVVGGATPNDSPFLRRPDLLEKPGAATGSAIRRCPTCSPACSSARPARRRASTRRAMTSLYELEIALAQVPRPGQGDAAAALAGRPAVPQSPDRRHRQHPPLRNLHRQAVFARRPDRPARAGRVPRLRDAAQCAHEPRPATCWSAPSSRGCGKTRSTAASPAGARRCTTASCCRTMSGPISSTCSTISQQNGFAFRPEWFDAQLEFRFPFCGEVQYAGIKLELRQALEPWHVMGEQGAIGGTVRFVDSSVERLQVRTEGLNPGAPRHRLQRPHRADEGRPTTARSPSPACATRRGSRRRACIRRCRSTRRWSSTSTTAGRGRPVGGCVYHVAHPGGRNYDTFPVNANEAEARRLARFEPRGHTPSGYELRQEEPVRRLSDDA